MVHRVVVHRAAGYRSIGDTDDEPRLLWYASPRRARRAVGELILSGRSTAPDSSATAFGRHDRVRLALAGPNVSPAAAQLVITSTEPGLMMPIRARTVVGEGTANCRRCGPEPKASDGPSSSHSGLFCA